MYPLANLHYPRRGVAGLADQGWTQCGRDDLISRSSSQSVAGRIRPRKEQRECTHGSLMLFEGLVFEALVLRYLAGGRISASIGVALGTVGAEMGWYGANHDWALTHDHIDMLINGVGCVLICYGILRSPRAKAIIETGSLRARVGASDNDDEEAGR
jgi:hypothetical protein